MLEVFALGAFIEDRGDDEGLDEHDDQKRGIDPQEARGDEGGKSASLF